MATGIKYSGTFTSHVGMRKVAQTLPLLAASRDWVFETVEDGATPATVLDLVAGVPLTVLGGTGATLGGKKVIALDGVAGHYLEDTTAIVAAQPFTIVAVYTLAAIVANTIIVGTSSGSGSTIGIRNGGATDNIVYGGTALLGTGVAAAATRTVEVAVYNGAGSVININGVEYSGVNIGSLGLPGGLRAGASSSGTPLTAMKFERLALIPRAYTSTERAAAVAAIS